MSNDDRSPFPTTTTTVAVTTAVGTAVSNLETDMISIIERVTSLAATDVVLLSRTLRRDLTERGYGFTVPVTVLEAP